MVSRQIQQRSHQLPASLSLQLSEYQDGQNSHTRTVGLKSNRENIFYSKKRRNILWNKREFLPFVITRLHCSFNEECTQSKLALGKEGTQTYINERMVNLRVIFHLLQCFICLRTGLLLTEVT